MARKTRKAQVVIAGYDAQSQTVSYLLLQTNIRRGSFWQNVTGKVDAGERYEEGAVREVIEETKLKPEWIVHFIDLELSHDFIDERQRDVHEKSYLLIADRVWDVTIDPHEHQGFRWVSEFTRGSVKHEGNFEALEKAATVIARDFT